MQGAKLASDKNWFTPRNPYINTKPRGEIRVEEQGMKLR